MINRQALLVVLAAAAAFHNADAFMAAAPCAIHQRTIRPTALFSTPAEQSEQIAEAYQQIIDETTVAEVEVEEPKMVMDIPPTPAATEEKPAAKKAPKKKMGNPHKEGVFSPIVVAASKVLGNDKLIKIRAKTISIHSDLIKSFVATSDSAFGKAVLKQLFILVDVDKSGYLDKEEVGMALELLGFSWLKDKQVAKIFERADGNGDEEISMEEFMLEAPKTLKVNLVKLAKQNGGDMGLLV